MILNSPAINIIRLILVDYKSPTAPGDNNTSRLDIILL